MNSNGWRVPQHPAVEDQDCRLSVCGAIACRGSKGDWELAGADRSEGPSANSDEMALMYGTSIQR